MLHVNNSSQQLPSGEKSFMSLSPLTKERAKVTVDAAFGIGLLFELLDFEYILRLKTDTLKKIIVQLIFIINSADETFSMDWYHSGSATSNNT